MRLLTLEIESAFMIYIVVGCLSFLILHLFDFASLKRWPGYKPVIWLLGSGLLVYSLVMMSLRANQLPLPVWITWVGWILLVTSFLLLIFSLFVNLPFRKTYISTGVGEKLITTGMYALVRHPWIHWFILAIIALIFVSRSSLLLIAAPIFILLNIILVIFQDKFFFGRMFDGYESYRQDTPMLVPNRKSLNAFVVSMKQRLETKL
ncbi:methyltransferase family protein [Chloroflexota bacterium]